MIEEMFSFQIEDEVMVIKITCLNGLWESEVISGRSGIGNCSGGKYENIDEYKEALIREHTYAYYFFKKGHKAAKQSIGL